MKTWEKIAVLVLLLSLAAKLGDRLEEMCNHLSVIEGEMQALKNISSEIRDNTP
jgi:hypothetical protein